MVINTSNEGITLEVGDRFNGHVIEKASAKTQDGASYEVSAMYEGQGLPRMSAEVMVSKAGSGSTDVVYQQSLPTEEMGQTEEDIRGDLQEQIDIFSRYLAASSNIEDFNEKMGILNSII